MSVVASKVALIIEPITERAKAALERIEAKIQSIGKKTQEGGYQVDLFGNKIEETAERGSKAVRKFAMNLEFVKRVLAGITVAYFYFQIIRGLEEAVRRSIDFEKSMVRLAALSAESADQIGTLAEKYMMLAEIASVRLNVGLNEAGQALDALVRAGLSSDEAMKALIPTIQLAAIEGENFRTAAASVVQVLAQFGLSGSQAGRVVDVLVAASREGIGTATDFANGLAKVGAQASIVGLSLEDTTALLVALERRFGSAEMAGTHLSRLLNELTEAAEKFGVETSNREPLEVLMAIIDKVRSLRGQYVELERITTGLNIRTRRTLAMFARMRPEEFEEIRAAIERMGQAQETYNAMMDTTAGKVDKLGSAWDRLIQSVVRTVSGPLTAAFQAWADILTVGGWRFEAIFGDKAKAAMMAFARAAQDVGKQTEDGIIAWSSALDEGIDLFKQAGYSMEDIAKIAIDLGLIMDDNLSLWSEKLGISIEKLKQMREEVEKAKKIIEEMKTPYQRVAEAVSDYEKAMRDAENYTKKAVQAMIDGNDELAESYLRMAARRREDADEFYEDIIEKSKDLTVTVGEAYQVLGDEFEEALGDAMDKIVDRYESMQKDMEDITDDLFQYIMDGNTVMAEYLILQYDRISDKANEDFAKIKGYVDDHGAEMVSAWEEHWQEMVDAANSKIDEMYKAVEDLEDKMADVTEKYNEKMSDLYERYTDKKMRLEENWGKKSKTTLIDLEMDYIRFTDRIGDLQRRLADLQDELREEDDRRRRKKLERRIKDVQDEIDKEYKLQKLDLERRAAMMGLDLEITEDMLKDKDKLLKAWKDAMDKKRDEELKELENWYNEQNKLLENKLNEELDLLKTQKQEKLKEIEDYVNKVKDFINSIPSEKIVNVRIVYKDGKPRIEATEKQPEFWPRFDYWEHHQVGTLFVHRRGLALLHPGEMVLTAEASRALLQFFGSMRPQKTANITMNFNVNGDGGDTKKLYRMICKVVRSELRRMGVWVQ